MSYLSRAWYIHVGATLFAVGIGLHALHSGEWWWFGGFTLMALVNGLYAIIVQDLYS